MDKAKQPPCPRCSEYDREEPNPRATTKSGNLLGYCKPCIKQYTHDRRRATTILCDWIMAVKDNPTNPGATSKYAVTDREWAMRILEPKKRGRRHSDNTCPRCEVNQRTAYSAYCAPCNNTYRQERRQRALEEHLSEVSATMRGESEELAVLLHRAGPPDVSWDPEAIRQALKGFEK